MVVFAAAIIAGILFMQSTDLQKIKKTLGVVPISCAINQGVEVFREKIQENKYGIISKVKIISCGEFVTLLEAVPHVVDPKMPVVIALHQTSNFGKNEVMGIEGNLNLSYGRSFYEKGSIVLAPDVFLAGDNWNEGIGWDTASFYLSNPKWSAMGKMLEDNIAVTKHARIFNPSCISVVGHSLGGHNALFLGAFNKNVDVIVSSAGFGKIATDTNAMRWARESWFIYMPLLRPFLKNPPPRTLPWDFDDILASISPRPTLVIHGKNDESWLNNVSIAQLISSLNLINLQLIEHENGHDFDPHLQDMAFEFIIGSCV